MPFHRRSVPPTRPRIAVCFFGIGRSLGYTLPSIERHVLAPARDVGEVRTFAHLFRLDRVANPRSGEDMALDPDIAQTLDADELVLGAPGTPALLARKAALADYGDRWADGAVTLGNLVHQLHSLSQVTEMALEWQPDIVLFCRPDLFYLDSFAPPLARLAAHPEPLCRLPFWQWYGGYNDRFALVKGRETIRAYGRRGDRAEEFCATGPRPLHSEALLRHALAGHPVKPVALRAARVRAHGAMAKNELFALNGIIALHEKVQLSRAPQRMKDGLHKGLRLTQSAIDLALYGRNADPWRDGRPEPEPPQGPSTPLGTG